MRFHKKFWLPIFPNLITYVEVCGDRLDYIEDRTKRFSLPINEVNPKLSIHGLLGFFTGYGSITLDHDGRSYDAPNLVDARELRRTIERIQAAAAKQAAERKAFETKDRVPENVTFGTTVLALPPIAGGLGNLISRKYCPTYHGSLLNRRWINRGEAVYSLPSTSSEAAIISPVNGLIIQGFSAPTLLSDSLWFFILLPEREPAPLPIKQVFGPLRDYLSKHRKRYMKNVVYSVTSAEFDEKLNDQLSREYVIRNMMTYEDDFGFISRESFVGWIKKHAGERADIARALEKTLTLIADSTSA